MCIKNKLLIGLTILMFGLFGYWCEAIVFEGNQLKKENLEIKKEILIEEQEKLQQHLQDLEFSRSISEMPKGKVMEISAYSELDSCHYPTADGECLVASGKIAKVGMVASNLYPFGTKLEIDGKIYTVEDRTAKKYSHRVDLFEGYGKEAHQRALKKGIQYKEVVKL